MICSIHQPNFFPWLGYFDKIYRADCFVFLDHVSYPKSSKTMSSWGNRVSVNIAGEKRWINCPIIREKGVQLIDSIKIDNRTKWREKLLKSLCYNYKKSAFFDEVFDFICELINYDVEYLCEYNINAIECISKQLKVDCSFIKQSDLDTKFSSNELLIEITQKVGCNQYMCGGGSSGYQNDELFTQKSIELIYQNFKQIEYTQNVTDFIGGLSILDALFCCGFKGTERLIKRENI